MTGLLAADGIQVCQLRVGNSLKRIDPASHHRRYTTTYQLIIPIPYQSSYCGEKLHSQLLWFLKFVLKTNVSF